MAVCNTLQALFFLVLGIGVLFLSLLLYITADINLQRACITVVRRLLKTVALRQVGPDGRTRGGLLLRSCCRRATLGHAVYIDTSPATPDDYMQVMGILGAMIFVRMGLEPLVRALRSVFNASVPWEKSSEYHILREVCSCCCSRPWRTTFTPLRYSWGPSVLLLFRQRPVLVA